MAKFGITGLLAMVTVVGRSATVVDKVAADGLQASDLQYLPEGYAAVAPLLDVKYSELLNEVNDLDESERTTLVDAFKSNFNLISDDTEAIIEEGVELLIQGAATIKGLYDQVMAFVGKVKAFQSRFG